MPKGSVILQAHLRQRFSPTVPGAHLDDGWHMAGHPRQRHGVPQSPGLRGGDASTLQPQISTEAAKLQQLGAKMGTKLRPESAQKIQVSCFQLQPGETHSELGKGFCDQLI